MFTPAPHSLSKSDGKNTDMHDNTLKLINKWNAGESEKKGEKKTKSVFICANPVVFSSDHECGLLCWACASTQAEQTFG